MNTLYKELGIRLKLARESKGLASLKAADLIGVHQPQISNYETGIKKIPPQRLIRLIRLYNVEKEILDFLFNHEAN